MRGGMGNMQKMMKQMQKMQKDMAKAQEELAEKVVEGTAGGGMVTVKANGQKKSWMSSSKRKSLIRKISTCFKT